MAKKKKPKKSMTRADFARRHNVTRPYIQQLVTAGVIPLTADRKIDPAAGDAAMAARPRAAEKRAAAAAGDEDVSALNRRLKEQQILRTKYQAERARLELETQKGIRVILDDVHADADFTAATIRQQLRTLGPRLGIALSCDCRPAGEVERIVLREINEILKELQNSRFIPRPTEPAE